MPTDARSPSTGPTLRYRPEVDGLRAIAVLPVVLFHAGIRRMAGGFVGVDVFFVISGYLITSLVQREIETGTFSLATFYERRARRILPALIAVVGLSTAFGWWTLSPNAMRDFAKSLGAVGLFVSNVQFWRASGYFDVSNTLRPLLHTWSLAVEEQYYVVFPLVLVGVWRFARRWHTHVIVAGLVASLALAQWGTHRAPSATFYLLPTRAWELLSGALLAVRQASRSRDGAAPLFYQSPRLADAVAAMGVAAIVIACLTFDEGIPMPGVFALLPVGGAVAVLAAASPANRIGRLLGSRPFVAVGLISYSLYLWHQPLLAFARLHFGDELSAGVLAAVLALCVVLAVATWRFVEQPFRDRTWLSRRAIFAWSLASSGALCAFGLGGVRTDGYAFRFPEFARLRVAFRGEFGRADSSVACFAGEEDVAPPCPLGEAHDSSTLFAIGDSHLFTLHEGLADAATRAGVGGRWTSMRACPPLDSTYVVRDGAVYQTCAAYVTRTMASVRASGARLVLLAARWEMYTSGFLPLTATPVVVDAGERAAATTRRQFVASLGATVRELEAMGAHVVVVEQVPQQTHDAAQVYLDILSLPTTEREQSLRELSVTTAQHHERQAVANALIAEALQGTHAESWSLDAVYCDAQRCPIGRVDTTYYNNESHLSIDGARRATTALTDLLQRYVRLRADTLIRER